MVFVVWHCIILFNCLHSLIRSPLFLVRLAIRNKKESTDSGGFGRFNSTNPTESNLIQHYSNNLLQYHQLDSYSVLYFSTILTHTLCPFLSLSSLPLPSLMLSRRVGVSSPLNGLGSQRLPKSFFQNQFQNQFQFLAQSQSQSQSQSNRTRTIHTHHHHTTQQQIRQATTSPSISTSSPTDPMLSRLTNRLAPGSATAAASASASVAANLARVNARQTPTVATPSSVSPVTSKPSGAKFSTSLAPPELPAPFQPPRYQLTPSPAPNHPLPESNQNVDAYFGMNVFDRRTMKKYLSTVENDKFHNAIANHKPIDFSTADAIANALLRWATERGATHYCHWFQVRSER